MIKKRYVFCAAFCLTAALLFSACAASAGVEDTAAPEAGGSSPVPEVSNGTDGTNTDPGVRSTPQVPSEDEPSEPLPSTEPAESPEPTEAPESPEPAEGSEPSSAPEPSQEERAPEYVPVAYRPPISDVVVAARSEPVGNEYFDDAAFIGNSLVDGFRLFSGLSNCDYYCKTSMTIFGIGDYITQMSSREYGKVYMLLGINELTYNLDTLMRAYAKAIDRLSNDHPNLMIYIMSVSPVSAKKDASGNTYTMANVYRFNERLLQLAEEKNCYYIDLCDALAGDDGFLPANVTTDGIHFVASEYKVWLDYLRYHYVAVGGDPEDPETEPGEDPGEDPGAEPGEDPGEDPGAEPGEDPEEGPGTEPGEDPGEDPETEPGKDPGEDPETEPGKDPGEDPETEPGKDPGEDPEEEPGEDPGEDLGTEPEAGPAPGSGPEMAV